jgi:hypothetical protein
LNRFKHVIITVTIILTGLSCNLLVTQVNGGMPAKINYAVPSKHAYDILNMPYPKYTALYEGTRLKFLADILLFNFSIGDILIIGGLSALATIVIFRLYKLFRSSKPIDN